MPPFDGPRATLCVTRCPWKTRVVPSSIETGMETDTAFLQSWRTLTRFGSIAKASATRRSCSRAISNGFSRRCETGASTVVTSTPFSAQIGTFRLGARSLLDRESDRPDCRGPRIRAVPEQAQLVVAAREHGPGRVTPGDAERVAAGQHVAQSREAPDATSVRAPELEVEPRERRHGRTACGTRHGAGHEAEQRGRRVGRTEGVHGEAHRADRRLHATTEENRPGHVHLATRGGGDHQ